MPQVVSPPLTSETISRVAIEDVRLPLSPAEIDALRGLLNPLLDEIRQITPRDVAGSEPEAAIVVEDWPV